MREPKPTVLPFTPNPLAVPAHKRPKNLADFPLTDEGNAEAFNHLYGMDVRYNHTTATFMLWDTVRWAKDTNGQAYRLAIDVVRARQMALLKKDTAHDEKSKLMKYAVSCENVSRLKSMLVATGNQETITTTSLSYDSNPYLAATRNGTLNLELGAFGASVREDYITKQFGCDYDQDATCPRFDQFLREVFNDDTELIEYVQRCVGYTLTGDVSAQVFFICYGKGGNGKSVLLDTLTELLGEYAGTASFQTFDLDNKSSIPSDLFALMGTRAVFISESNEHKKLDTARIKAVTGNKTITARDLYCPWVTFPSTFKPWLATNYKPSIYEDSDGIWRRVKLIPFEQSFIGREDPTLLATLQQELSGILNWALAGLRAYQERGCGMNGIGSCTAVETATAAYRKDSDLFEQWLDDEEFVSRLPDEWSSTTDCYESFMAWQKAHGHDYPCKSITVSRRLKEKGFHARPNRVHGHQLNGYQGLQVRT